LWDAVIDPDIPIEYNDKFREYGIRILDGGSAILRISHCPWCGCELPASLRDEWLECLKALGLEPGDPEIPKKFLNSDWWRRADSSSPSSQEK
jgi:hypothetical protein